MSDVLLSVFYCVLIRHHILFVFGVTASHWLSFYPHCYCHVSLYFNSYICLFLIAWTYSFILSTHSSSYSTLLPFLLSCMFCITCSHHECYITVPALVCLTLSNVRLYALLRHFVQLSTQRMTYCSEWCASIWITNRRCDLLHLGFPDKLSPSTSTLLLRTSWMKLVRASL